MTEILSTDSRCTNRQSHVKNWSGRHEIEQEFFQQKGLTMKILFNIFIFYFCNKLLGKVIEISFQGRDNVNIRKSLCSNILQSWQKFE